MDLLRIIRKPFFRNVATVATGTAAAQAIAMAFAPVITRLYGPEAFGVLGTFSAVANIIIPVASLTYPIAIVLPARDGDALGIAKLSLLISAGLAAFLLIFALASNGAALKALRIESLSPFLILIPLVVFFDAAKQVAEKWLMRKKHFKVTAKASVISALIINGAKSGIGFLTPTAAALVLLSTCGYALNALMLAFGAKKAHAPAAEEAPQEPRPSKGHLLSLAKRYGDFPLFRAPQVLLSSASHGLPVLMLASFFGPAAAGYYTLGYRVLGIPFQLIAKSISDVFYPRIAQAANEGEDLTGLIVRGTLLLSALGIVPNGLVFAFGPWLFGFVFGAEWTAAGEYARWISLLMFFGFLSRASFAAVPVLRMQSSLLVYEVVSLALKIAAIYYGYTIFKSDLRAIAFFCMAGVAAYAFLTIWVIYASLSRRRPAEPAGTEGMV